MFLMFQVQAAEPGGGRVLQRSHPRGGRREPGAAAEVRGEAADALFEFAPFDGGASGVFIATLTLEKACAFCPVTIATLYVFPACAFHPARHSGMSLLA